MAKINRHEIPTDGTWHVRPMSGPTYGVGSRRPNEVEFWGADDPGTNEDRQYIVLQTGDDIPPGVHHVGTTKDAGGYFVWHLFSRAL